ncbi:MAG: hypothetical protein RML46_02485 [Anaerolineae bacterium]|nr:hypothetical protein [Anaerolineae bacterium]MDW8067763.1 hypothetical protein [Anaerolineae bacterium]
MTQNRERLAWIILLVSFTLCVGLAVGVPLGVRQFLRMATRAQPILLQPLHGTPGLQRGGHGEFIALQSPTWDVPAGSFLVTDSAAQALLTFHAPASGSEVVATVQVYGDTRLRFQSARSPRFGLSSLPHHVGLRVESGRVRITVSPAGGRRTVAKLHTPHLTAELTAGSYEARVYGPFTEFIVREGDAKVVSAGGSVVSLNDNQRTIAQAGPAPLEALPTARNLLINGDFRQPLEVGWETYTVEVSTIQPPAYPITVPATVQTTTFAGRPAARFFREGIGHAEVGIRQTLNQNVQDLASLILHLNVMVQSQSLPGCGSRGSECPIIVRIDYQDVFGGDQTWYHGFFSSPRAETDPLYWWSDQIPFQTWVSYDSENLMQSGAPPAVIKSVTIYASGHSFDALVTEVELLAQE